MCTSDDVETMSTLVDTSDRWTIVGTTYPVGVSDAQMVFVSSYSKTVTGGIAAYDGGGNWSASGSKTVSTTWGTDWGYSGYPTGYKVTVRYGKYRWQECYSTGNCWYDYEWRPMYPAGGTSHYSATYPGWNYDCQRVSNNSTWKRDSSSGYSYTLSTGVDISGIIGFDLGVKRAYESAAGYHYRIKDGSPKKMCSNMDGVAPAYAPKVVERYA
jgi:hypothetical protein